MIMEYIKRTSLLITFCLFLGVYSSLFAQENADKGVFIVNASVPVESVSKKELEKIFLGKMQAWEGKLKVSPSIMHHKTDIGDRFFDDVLDMSYRKYNKHWLKIVFSGSNAAPPEFKTVEEIIAYVSQKDGGIGFVPASAAKDLESCKVLTVQGMDGF